MKRLLAMILIVSMVLSGLCLSVSAEQTASDLMTDEINSLVVLGDSISTGYGLEGTVSTRKSYANLVAKALDVGSYVNYAVDGYTAAQVLQKAKDNEATLSEADMIMMTVGGNDVMWKMLAIAMQSVGVYTFDLAQIAIAMAQTDPLSMTAVLYSQDNVAIIDGAIENYRANLALMVEYLRSINPDARVLFLTQYNPSSGLTAFGVLQAYSEAVITQLNTVMTEVVTAGGYEIVDTHAVMVGKGAEMSNILAGDIHPNAYGHEMMAEKVKEYLNIADAEKTPVESTEEMQGMTTVLPDVTSTEPPAATAESSAATVTTATSVSETAAVTSLSSTAAEDSVADPAESEETSAPGEKTVSAVPVIIGVVLLAVGVTAVTIGLLIFKKR